MALARSLFTVAVLGGVTASLLVVSASCVEDPDRIPAADGRSIDGAMTPNEDASPLVDARSADASSVNPRGDAGGDAGILPSPACASLPAVVCNADGVCPPLAGIGLSGHGQPGFARDAGPDGSAAFQGLLLDGGGMAILGLPFQEFRSDGPTPPIVGCRVTCEANIRVAEGTTSSTTIVLGGDSFQLGIADGGWIHTASDAATQTSTLPVSTEWVHVTIKLSPSGDAGAISQVTLAQGGVSSTTSVPILLIGQQMRFGALGAGAVNVYVDDIVCRVSE